MAKKNFEKSKLRVQTNPHFDRNSSPKWCELIKTEKKVQKENIRFVKLSS